MATVCSALLFCHKEKYSLVDMGVARMNSTKLKGISKWSLLALPFTEYSRSPVNKREEEGVGFWKFTEPRMVTCSSFCRESHFICLASATALGSVTYFTERPSVKEVVNTMSEIGLLLLANMQMTKLPS